MMPTAVIVSLSYEYNLFAQSLQEMDEKVSFVNTIRYINFIKIL